MEVEKKENDYDLSFLNKYLQSYYRFLFPHNLFYQWLSYGNVKTKYFENREFSFTLAGDIYIRFNSFDDLSEMRKAINSRLPLKIDIGAVYNSKPKNSKRASIHTFTPEERELVFDIDMTDYDDVRNCCSGAAICEKCWPFMVIAAKILYGYLSEDFGYKNLLWVYSGRRGIHCWVADESARKLVSHVRDAVANFINIFDGGQFKAKKVELNGIHSIHPSIERSVGIIDNYFEDLIVKNQDFLSKKEQIEQIINLCQDDILRKELRTYVLDPQLQTTSERWNTIVKLSKNFYGQSHSVGKLQIFKHRYFIEEIKLQLCFPRLDINVTKGLNHLLKVPFSVHPKTGRVCVPIEFTKIDQFDPFKVPTVSLLCKEVDQILKAEDQTEKIASNDRRIAEKTSIASSLNIFREFINTLTTKCS